MMESEYTIVTAEEVTEDALKHAVRVLGGSWLKYGGRDEGVIRDRNRSVAVRLSEPTRDDGGVVSVSSRSGDSANAMAETIARMLARRWNGSVPQLFRRFTPPFTYFEGPVEEMSHVADGEPACTLCGQIGLCFTLEFADCPELTEQERESAVGCVGCLRQGRYKWGYRNTEAGVLLSDCFVDGDGEVLSRHGTLVPSVDAREELRRTPDFNTWQESIWLVHCCDFMVYIGSWEPQDFHDRSPNGDGRLLFVEMTDASEHHWWDRRSAPGERGLEAWYCSYYAFRCRHCGKLRGYLDYP